MVAVAALALLAAACGDDDDDSAATPTSGGASTTAAAPTTAAGGQSTTSAAGASSAGTATSATATASGASGQFADLKHIDDPATCASPAPGVTADSIKVGVIMPTSGQSAVSLGDIQKGIEARVDKANTEGELGARKIDLEVLDDQGDPARNLEVARQAVESENVFAIIEASPFSDSSAQYLDDKGIPVTGWYLGVPSWATHTNFFTYKGAGIAPTPDQYTSVNADAMAALGGTKVALVGGGNQSSVLYINQVEGSIKEVGKSEVVYKTVDVAPGQSDFTTIVEDIRASGADSLFTGMDFLPNTALSSQLQQAGVEMKAVFFPGGYDPRVLQLPGIEGATFGIDHIPFSENPPAYQQFDKYLPEDATRNGVAYIGWMSADSMVRGLQEAGKNCPTREAFIDNLRLVKDYTGQGAFNPVDFAALFGTQWQCGWFVKVQDAAFVPLFDGEEFCGKPITIDV
jgi:ABC-type branched-subunit amino acid transport system substrate-binding protein